MELVVTDEERQIVENGGEPLMDLCRLEAERFSRQLVASGTPPWSDGLSPWEMDAISGYLYQKLRGRIV